jgi:epoxyqueuosine reductase
MMRAKTKIRFAKDPEKSIEQTITKFVMESPSNRRKVDGKRYFDSPIVGFASADNHFFKEYKKIIGKFHFTPREIFELTFGKGGSNSELSVISWVLPISEDTRMANRREREYPSLLWGHTRYFGEQFNVKLRNHVVSVLKRRGYKSVAPTNSPHFIHHMHSRKVGFTSNWSERHAAYACGLGTFALCDGLITPKGKAVRLGTVITDLILKPSDTPYRDFHGNCLHYFNGKCMVCVARCPGGAITAKGHDKDKCYEYMRKDNLQAKKAEYGVKIAGCGLCQTKVPCEFEIPTLLQRQLELRTSSGR